MNTVFNRTHPIGVMAACWGLLGVLALLGSAIIRLGSASLEALQTELTTVQILLLLANVAFMAYSEGYKGFQKNFSPRFAARMHYLTGSRSAMELVLAPLFCLNFFNAPRKRIIVSCSLLVMIVTLVTLFRFIPQPWRGILDAGVVIGLCWGLLSTVWFCIRVFTDSSFSVSPEIPRPSYVLD